MRKNFLTKFFPPPAYLLVPASGLDFSDEAVRLVGLQPNGPHHQVAIFDEIILPYGIIENGLIKQSDVLRAALTDLKNKHQLVSVAASLPAGRILTAKTKMNPASPAELRARLAERLGELFPGVGVELVFDYRVSEGNLSIPGLWEVTVVAVPQAISLAYSEVVRGAGLLTTALEPQTEARIRAFLPPTEADSVLLVDFGRTQCSLSFIESGILTSFEGLDLLSGNLLTHTLSRALGVPLAEAEDLKNRHGLGRAAAREELFGLLLPAVSALGDEIKVRLSRWPANQVLVAGREANLPGLIDYLTASLSAPVKRADPWRQVNPLQNYVPPIDRVSAQAYAAAIGLALGGSQHHHG